LFDEIGEKIEQLRFLSDEIDEKIEQLGDK